MKVGELIGGRFELRQVLGEGGMGQVFKAWDTELERFVAIKTLLTQFLSDPAALDEMKQEVRISQRLNHPAIVAVYDYRVHERTPYIIMEFVDGVPLHHHLFRQPQRKLDEPAVLALVDLILAGVGYAHERGVVHRDLKPANIMVQSAGGVKLMDFGIAAAIKATYTRVTGRTSGLTIQYSSPEQINGEAPSASMDIYSLGCVLYEMLTGHPPFYQGEVLHQQLTRQPPPMPGVSPWLSAVVLACLVKDPKKRLRSIPELRAALTGERTVKVAKQSASGPAPVSPSGLLRGAQARLAAAMVEPPLAVALITGGLGLVVLSAVLAGALLGGPSRTPPPLAAAGASAGGSGVTPPSTPNAADPAAPPPATLPAAAATGTRPGEAFKETGGTPTRAEAPARPAPVAKAARDDGSGPANGDGEAARDESIGDLDLSERAWRRLQGLVSQGDLRQAAAEYGQFLSDDRTAGRMRARARQMEQLMLARARGISDPDGRVNACEVILDAFPTSAGARQCVRGSSR